MKHTHSLRILIFSLAFITTNILVLHGQNVNERVEYLPEFNSKSVTIINQTDTVKVLYVTDSTIVAWLGNGPYDTLILKDHLKIYRVDSVKSFYQRQKGKILLKTVGFGLSLGVVGTLTVGALGTKSESDIVGPAGAGLAIGLMTGIMIGLVSGLANYQKFVWTNENSRPLNLKKVKKYQACYSTIPYHLYRATQKQLMINNY